MKKGFQILILLGTYFAFAQINTVQSVYFELDKFILPENEIQQMTKRLDSIEISRFNAIYLYGYCDDRGSVEYNEDLSKKRVKYIQKILLSKGVPEDKIFICEGRGEVALDLLDDIEKTRDKNRRVDLILVKKALQTTFPENPKVGDNIILNRVRFDMGSSELTPAAIKELDQTVLLLKKNKTVCFEIKGHVCCTSKKFSDAIDKESQDRDLSENRARKVFMYFRSQGISPYRMSYKGYGNRFPLGKEDALDRRVELYITKL